MIPEFVIRHYAYKKEIAYETSYIFHQELESFFQRVVKENRVIPTNNIDDVWHNFILHTRLYEEYCTRTYGQFIHHNPKIRGEGCNGEQDENCDALIDQSSSHADCHGEGSSCDSQFS